MSQAPLTFHSTHRIKFSELDPYKHVSTGHYATYYVDHRLQGLREYVGWDLTALDTLPFMVWTRRMEIDFIRPARGDQDVTITSFVRAFRGADALIECTIVDAAGKTVSRCLMTVAYVDMATNRAADWPTTWSASSSRTARHRAGAAGAHTVPQRDAFRSRSERNLTRACTCQGRALR